MFVEQKRVLRFKDAKEFIDYFQAQDWFKHRYMHSMAALGRLGQEYREKLLMTDATIIKDYMEEVKSSWTLVKFDDSDFICIEVK